MSSLLIVKTSSLGDIIHCLPVIADIRANVASIDIDWVAEENFAELPALHPGVRQVYPVAVRRWRRRLLSADTWQEMRDFRDTLREEFYEMVLDTQGLVKSALIASRARGGLCGYTWGSAREPLASLFYDRKLVVDTALHAVVRNRQLAGRAFGYDPQEFPLDYGLPVPEVALPWKPVGDYVVLLHATSRADKLWNEAHWVELGRTLHRRGLFCVLPFGSAVEQARAMRLADQIPDACLPPALTLEELAALLGHARSVVGVDTGLTHLAAALRTPTLALYCGSRPGLTGVYARSFARNLGDLGAPPSLAEVLHNLEEALT
jgi:heptosyltransferase-1